MFKKQFFLALSLLLSSSVVLNGVEPCIAAPETCQQAPTAEATPSLINLAQLLENEPQIKSAYNALTPEEQERFKGFSEQLDAIMCEAVNKAQQLANNESQLLEKCKKIGSFKNFQILIKFTVDNQTKDVTPAPSCQQPEPNCPECPNNNIATQE